jgi:hypothetical protein
MAKFYVQSGSIRGVVDCYDSECAAVWAVNLVMTRSTKSDDQSPSIAEEVVESDELGMFALDDSIRVSERGFDRDDCEEIDTHLAFVHWHQLSKAIESLQQQLDELYE